MSDEQVVEKQEEIVIPPTGLELDLSKKVAVKEEEKSEESKPIEYTAEEQEAISQGWVPRDKFKGDLSEFKGAKAFLKDGKLFKHNEINTKKIQELQKTVDLLLDQQNKLAVVTKEQRIAELKKKLADAASIGEVDTVLAVNDELVKTTTPVAKSGEEIKQAQVQQEMAKFISKHPTLINPISELDRIVRAEVDRYDNELANVEPNLTPAEHFTKLHARALEKKLELVDLKPEPKVNRSVVESASNTITTKSSKVTFKDLGPVQKNIVRPLMNIKGFDFDEYLDSCKTLGVNIYE